MNRRQWIAGIVSLFFVRPVRPVQKLVSVNGIACSPGLVSMFSKKQTIDTEKMMSGEWKIGDTYVFFSPEKMGEARK